MKILFGYLIFSSLLVPQFLFSQNIGDKFSIGLRVGPNLWINDMNDRRVSFGAEGSGRYGLADNFSAGVILNYEILKAGQFPLRPPDLPVDYLKIVSFSTAVQGWLFLAPGRNFSPYLYSGFGVSFYSREDGQGNAYPNVQYKNSSSLYVPFGIGFESFVAKNTAVSFDLGYRILSQNTDFVLSGSPDGFMTTKVGVSLYFGSNGEDDDDNDGISNGKEIEMGLDPHNPDTDGDGLTDGEEVLKYHTDPKKVDTDGDGLSDYDEIWRFRTDPLRADTDKDGLSDGDEILKYNTDPLKVDTDKDGLSDGEEILTYHTDPLKADTDGDGLSDSNELFGYKTDPRVADTDGGGVNDGDEVKHGTNPLNPADDIPKEVRDESVSFEIGSSLVAEGIKFKSGKSEFTSQSETFLIGVLETLEKHPEIDIEIRGYTDDEGSRAKNIKLSYDRALAVKRWMSGRGISEGRLSVRGYGPENPLAPNSTEEGREKNRRIEFYRIK